MGYTGLVSISLNAKVIPDLAFFDLIISKNYLLTISILVLDLGFRVPVLAVLILIILPFSEPRIFFSRIMRKIATTANSIISKN